MLTQEELAIAANRAIFEMEKVPFVTVRETPQNLEDYNSRSTSYCTFFNISDAEELHSKGKSYLSTEVIRAVSQEFVDFCVSELNHITVPSNTTNDYVEFLKGIEKDVASNHDAILVSPMGVAALEVVFPDKFSMTYEKSNFISHPAISGPSLIAHTGKVHYKNSVTEIYSIIALHIKESGFSSVAYNHGDIIYQIGEPETKTEDGFNKLELPFTIYVKN